MPSQLATAVARAFFLEHGERIPVVRFTVIGDSIAAQPGTEPYDGHTVNEGEAWHVQDQGGGGFFWNAPLSKDQAYVGRWSGWTYLAQSLSQEAGVQTTWDLYAKSAIAINRDAAPARHYDWRFPTNEDGNYFFFPEPTQDNRSFDSMYAATETLYEECPLFDVQSHFLIWWSGSTDAAAITAGTITQQDLIDSYVGSLSWWKVLHGVDGLFIMGSSERGDDPADADNEQAVNRDMAAVRETQRMVAEQEDDIWLAFDNNPVRGDPFNTFQTDTAGRWTGGTETYDGIHPSESFTKAACKRAALNIALSQGWMDPIDVSPVVSLEASLSGRVVTLEVTRNDATPAATAQIDVLTNEGADVLSNLVEVVAGERWTYTAPSAVGDVEIYALASATNGVDPAGANFARIVVPA